MKTKQNSSPNIDDPQTLLDYLKLPEHQNRAESILWTLKLDDSPIYAIKPMGAFAAEVYSDFLIAFLQDVVAGVERFSVPGVIVGQVQLFTGETVPLIAPDARGMYSWTTSELVKAVRVALRQEKPAKEHPDQVLKDVCDFFDRVYFELRNLGISPQDRAINYAATDALRVSGVFQKIQEDPALRGFQLDTINVERSPLCRPDSDCWDVKLFFFDPTNLQQSRHVFRFTVDVSDVMPVMIGPLRHWPQR
jgi:cyanobactin maturation PatA/PatG family protease